MRIAFNPSTVAALTTPPNNKDITFDLKGRNIFARGVKFYGTDTNTWRPVVDNLTSNSTTSSLSANQGRVLKALIDGKSDSGHNHDNRYLRLTGGTMQLGEGLKFHANDNYFGTNADARIISLLDGNDKICDGGLIIDERGTLDGKEYVTELLRIRDSEFKWKGNSILHNGNYAGILDSRYYTETEINTLLNAKLNRQNLSYGTWNPRGYNLAADYYYNGGDLSISENGGKMYVSIDGQFYQNEGQYRVLDTSDITSIRGGLTLYQYLSSTNNNWFPLVWGGSDHKNTNNSTGSLYKSHDKLSWQTSSQTLYATNIRTENIKNLSIGGGIYWSPYVESATDGSDAASITVVKAGVAGGTTLVLSQQNDSNDTIQFKTSDAARLYHNSNLILTSKDTKVSSGKGYINNTEITQVNNATNATNSTNARKLVNWYSARPTSLNAQFGDGSLRIFNATSSTTEGKPAEDSHILHLAWDNAGGWDAQLAVHTRSGKVSTRAQSSGTWQPWKTLAFTTDIPSSLKNPHSLTLKANGTTLATYDGSSAKEANFTYANVGAASASHTHSYYAVNENYGGFKKAERLPTSGFYQSYISDKEESGGNAPWKSWIHLINCQHNNTNNNYALQIAASFFDNNIFKIRVTNNGVNTAWRNIIHSGNIGSQSVNYANSAADSDKLDGKHASDFATAGHNHDGRYVKIWGNVEANFNFPDGEGHSGVYMCHTTKTQSNKPETYGLLTDFSTLNGHLQFFGASSNKIYTRTYWWTGQDNFKYTDWHTLLHTGNSSVSGHTITINGSSTTWSNSWRPIGTGASDAAAGNHTHKVKINGNEKIITATDAKDVVDLGTYLTSHQSLAGYVNTVETIGAGNAVTSIVKAGGKITANKGTTFLTSHQSLANYYTKGQVDAKLGKYLPLAGGTMNAGAQIQRTATSGMWYQGRSIALLRETSAGGYHALWSLKTTDGSWDFGEYKSSGWNNIPVLSYVLDSNFNKGSNTTTYQIKFPLASGTVALTSNIPNPTNYYWANNKITSTSKIDAEVRVKNLGAGCLTTIENTIMATNWVRAMGNTGIYFQDHGGGLYMSDNTWIRTWAGKALQVDNTIRSTDFNTTHYANNVWTITSAAKLENSTTLVYGTSTSSQSINTYLRGTNVILQVKKGTSTNYNALQLTSDRINCNNYCDMKYGAAVSGGNLTVQNNAYLAQSKDAKVGIGINTLGYCKLTVGGDVMAYGFHHTSYDNNDAMLLAGGGWKKLSTLVEYPSDRSYIYRKTTTEYDLRFVKLVNFNNLIYVDGWISADANGKSFTLGAKFKPYLYRNDHSMPTIVQMGWDDVVTIDGDGNVGFHIEGGRKKRIGFFYTGRA